MTQPQSTLVGYSRVSTASGQEAGLESQVRDLTVAGCSKIFSERVSSVLNRAKLETAIDYCREGDVLVVTKLDRLCRSARDLQNIIEQLEAKKVGLRILQLGSETNVDLRSAIGRLLLNLLVAVAQVERESMLERQQIGIAKAKAAGKYKGRKPTARLKANDARKLYSEGKKPAEIARMLGIGRTSVYRALETTGHQ
jgi:DNA invertase Pin-like site-specific DNA recombinase